MIFFGEDAFCHAVRSYVEQYHQERNHQGLSNAIIRPGAESGRAAGDVDCRERMGGLLRYDHRCAS